MKPVFEFTKGMREMTTSYCPGCTHGIAHRLIMVQKLSLLLVIIPYQVISGNYNRS